MLLETSPTTRHVSYVRPTLVQPVPEGRKGNSDCRTSPRWPRKEGETINKAISMVTQGALIVAYLYLVAFVGQHLYALISTVEQTYDLRGSAGGAFVLFTVPLSGYLILQHLLNFVESRQQSQIVRIVFMVPVYSICSFASLVYPNWSLAMATVRECYEAYVIYCFLHYLIGQSAEPHGAEGWLASKSPAVGAHRVPFCCLPQWTMGDHFLRRCKQGVFQYVMLRVVLTLMALWLQLCNLYTHGDFNPAHGYIWITAVSCVSQCYALYVLLLFYTATRHDIAHVHPMGKFLAIKGIVFCTWWQGTLIEVLEHEGWIIDIGTHKASHVAQGIQDLLICMEMLVASLGFLCAFPVSDYTRPAREHPPAAAAIPAAAKQQGSPLGGTGARERLGSLNQRDTHTHKSHESLQVGEVGERVPAPLKYAVWASVVPIEIHEDVNSFIDKIASCVRQRVKRKVERRTKKAPVQII
ncbi:unnamed protein product [Chrysoparadoxa australica]